MRTQGRNLASVRTAFGTYKGEVDDDATADTLAEDPEVGDWSERNDVAFTAAR